MHLRLTVLAPMVAAASLLIASEALAWPGRVEDQPSNLESTEAAHGVYFWTNDDERLSVRVVGDRQYNMTFRLHYGEFSDLEEIGIDQNDTIERTEDKGTMVVKIAGSD